MKSLPVNIWRELQLAVVQLNEKSSLRDLLSVILAWIRANSNLTESEPFSTYGFNNFINIDDSSMPVDYSTLKKGDVDHAKKVILGYKSNETESIARFLRDTLEALITIEVNRKCSSCEREWMRAFVGRKNGLLAYQCDVCGHSRYSDGSAVETDELAFVSQEKLRVLGLI